MNNEYFEKLRVIGEVWLLEYIAGYDESNNPVYSVAGIYSEEYVAMQARKRMMEAQPRLRSELSVTRYEVNKDYFI